MVLHLGGVYGDKASALDRFRENYATLAPNIKHRLVLENDDVSWSVHDLLPFCEELNIPMVLDFHHHNIIFDADKIREGTKDIMDLFPRIIATWKKKNKTPKMHYSEPTPSAITGRQRRKHSPRVATLPPCPNDMDLMIEAKDKEQAVFELMRTFKLPGYDTFNDMLPHIRKDDNKVVRTPKKKAPRKNTAPALDGIDAREMDEVIADDEVGMGGPEGRVYWPPGMEDWLRPVKRIVAKKLSPPELLAAKKAKTAETAALQENDKPSKQQTSASKSLSVGRGATGGQRLPKTTPATNGTAPVSKQPARASKKATRSLTPEDETSEDFSEPSASDTLEVKRIHQGGPRSSTRAAAKGKRVSYADADDEH